MEFGLAKGILVVISGVAWTLVYLGIIYRTHKDKAHGMPLFALGLNFGWEWLYSLDGIFFHVAPMISLQVAANIAWAICDVVILVLYFKYAKDEMPVNYQKYFIPWSVLALLACFALQLAFYLHSGVDGAYTGVEASQYSAFAQNAAMSILFVAMLMRRGNTKGQSYTIAWAKMLGTLAPTILGAIVEGPNLFILITGIICFIYDCMYIVMLYSYRKKEKVAVF